MQAILDRIMQEKWSGILYILPNEDLPFLFMLDYKAVGRGKTMESAMVEAIQAMDRKI